MCLFCKIINKEISAQIVYEDEYIIAFKDISPKAKIHILVLPKKHIASVAELQEIDKNLIGECLFRIKLIAQEKGIAESGYKIIINTGPDSGQLVSHLHFHLLGGEKLSGIV